MKPSRVFLLVLFFLALAVDLQAASKTVAAAKADPLLTTMQRELHRASTELAKSQPAPYYLSYTVRDQDATFVVAGQGAIISSIQVRGRLGDVVTRVGSPTLDNTHNSSRGSALMTGQIPLDDDDAAITRTLWQLTNRGYLRASRAFLQVKTSTAVRAEEEDTSADFSQEPPQTHEQVMQFKGVDAARWQEKVRAISRHFSDYPDIETNMVMISVQNTKQYFVSTEGSRIVSPSQVSRLFIMAAVRADDGMQLFRFESFLAPTPEQLPSEAELAAKITKIAADLKQLRTASIA